MSGNIPLTKRSRYFHGLLTLSGYNNIIVSSTKPHILQEALQ